VQQTESALRNFEGDIVVTCGDVPLLQSSTLSKLVEARRANNAAASLPRRHGGRTGQLRRVIRDSTNRVHRIVEAKDASPEEKQCRDVNAGTYCFQSAALWRELARIGNNNASGEYY
jgi:bifunctional UDP-N-acetylglucosamine pyrophosphorylase/glucosamine-1-phosphate N-acetyltransferase